MGRYINDGILRWFWVTTLSNPPAPSAVQVNAGVELTPFTVTTPDFPQSGSTADASDIGSAFNKTVPGTYGGDKATATMYLDREDLDNEAWDTFERLDEGYAVVFPYGVTGSQPGSGDRADVYRCTVITKQRQATARNDTARFTLELSIDEEPLMDVTLVAGS